MTLISLVGAYASTAFCGLDAMIFRSNLSGPASLQKFQGNFSKPQTLSVLCQIVHDLQECKSSFLNMDPAVKHQYNNTTDIMYQINTMYNESNHDVQPNLATQAPPGNCETTVFFFVVYGPLYGLVSAFGLVGNSLSFAVLHRYSRKSVATYLLKALAVSDNLFLATASFLYIYPAMCLYFGLAKQLEPIYPYLQTFGWPLAHGIQMGTVWVMVLVAANRYVAVCKPLHAPRLCSMHRVKLQILFMTLSIVIYNIPRFFEYRYVTRNHTVNYNETELIQENVGLQSYIVYNIVYENISYCLFVFLLPLIVLIFFNWHLVQELKKARKSRTALTSRSSMEENNITLVMIVIILIFIICQTPASVNQILFYIVDESQKETCSNYLKYYHVSNLLITTNSSVNFIVYCVFRRQFQQDVLKLLCCTKKKKTFNTRTYSYMARQGSSMSYKTTSNCGSECVPLQVGNGDAISASVNSKSPLTSG